MLLTPNPSGRVHLHSALDPKHTSAIVVALTQVIASLDVLFQPLFNLQRIIEHAMVRGKDTLVFHRPPPGADLSQHAQLTLDDVSLDATNPRVLAAEPAGPSSAVSDGITSAVLAPLLVLRRTSLPDLFPSAAAMSAPAVVSGETHARSQAKQLSALIQDRLLTTGKPVYAIEEDFCLDVSTAAGIEGAGELVAALGRAANRQQAEAGGCGPAAQALAEVVQVGGRCRVQALAEFVQLGGISSGVNSAVPLPLLV